MPNSSLTHTGTKGLLQLPAAHAARQFWSCKILSKSLNCSSSPSFLSEAITKVLFFPQMAEGLPHCVGHKAKHSKCLKSHLCGFFYWVLVSDIKELCICKTAGPQSGKVHMQKLWPLNMHRNLTFWNRLPSPPCNLPSSPEVQVVFCPHAQRGRA